MKGTFPCSNQREEFCVSIPYTQGQRVNTLNYRQYILSSCYCLRQAKENFKSWGKNFFVHYYVPGEVTTDYYAARNVNRFTLFLSFNPGDSNTARVGVTSRVNPPYKSRAYMYIIYEHGAREHCNEKIGQLQPQIPWGRVDIFDSFDVSWKWFCSGVWR